MMRRLCLLSLLAIAIVPRGAAALEHQSHLGLDPSLSILKVDDKSTVSVGAGIGAHYTYGINDQFNIIGEFNFSRVANNQQQDAPDSPHTRPADVSHLSAGVGYVIDVLRFVPYIGVTIGPYLLSGGTLDKNLWLPAVSGMIGLDYQLNRSFAVGIAGEQHIFFSDMSTYPSYTNVTLKAEYMWGF